MTRWLRAAIEGPEALTELTKPTEPHPMASNTGVLSVKSVLSGGGEISTDTLAAWQERAAIREFDGGQSRKDAECAAAKEVGVELAELKWIQWGD